MEAKQFLTILKEELILNEELTRQQSEFKEILETLEELKNKSFIKINKLDIEFEKRNKLKETTHVLFDYYGTTEKDEILNSCKCGSSNLSLKGKFRNSLPMAMIECENCKRLVEGKTFNQDDKEETYQVLSELVKKWNE